MSSKADRKGPVLGSNPGLRLGLDGGKTAQEKKGLWENPPPLPRVPSSSP